MIFFNWKNDDLFGSFIFENPISRFPIILKSSSRYLVLVGDAECNCTFPYLSSPGTLYSKNNLDISFQYIFGYESFVNYKNKRFAKDNFFNIVKTIFKDIVYVELNNSDIIFGPEQAITEAVKCGIKKKSNIMIMERCISKLTGVNTEDIINKLTKKNNTDIFYDKNTCDSMETEFIQKYGEYFKNKPEKYYRGINIVGFRNSRGLEELILLLKKIKLKINLVILPEVNITKIHDFSKANVSILNNNVIFRNIYNSIKMDTLLVNSPFGFKNSMEWLRKVCHVEKINIKNNKYFRDYIIEKRNQFNKLKKEAGKYTVGFIINEKNYKFVTEENFFNDSIDILSLLDEMNFNIKCYVKSDKKNYKKIKREIKKRLINSSKYQVVNVGNKSVEELLKRSDCDCIYSDFYSDNLVFLNGKNSFSFLIFEMGFEGAIRSISNIINYCSNSFFKKYQKYNSIHIRRLLS